VPPQDSPVRPPEVRGDWYPSGSYAGTFALVLTWPTKGEDARFDVHVWVRATRRYADRPVEGAWREHDDVPFPLVLDLPYSGASGDIAVYALVAIRDRALGRWWYVEIAANLMEQRAYAELAHDAFDALDALDALQPMVGGRIGFQKKALIGSQVEIAPTGCELLVGNVDEHAARRLTVWFETEPPQTWRIRSVAQASVRGGTLLGANAGVQATGNQFAKLPASFAGDATAYLYVDVEATDAWSRALHWRYFSEAMPLDRVNKASPVVFELENRLARAVSASLLAPT
jgi:hypothetical protein